MQMLKKTLYIIGLTSLVSLLLVGCGKSQDSKKSDKPYGAGQTSKKVASSSTTSTSSSSMSSASSSSQTNQVNAKGLDNKTIGILAMLYSRPQYLTRYINETEPSSGIFYGTIRGNSKDPVNGYSYMTGEGDPTSYLYYKNENGIIKLKEWIPRESVADGYYKSTSISLNDLIKGFYSNKLKQDEAHRFANKVKLDSQFGK